MSSTAQHSTVQMVGRAMELARLLGCTSGTRRSLNCVRFSTQSLAEREVWGAFSGVCRPLRHQSQVLATWNCLTRRNFLLKVHVCARKDQALWNHAAVCFSCVFWNHQDNIRRRHDGLPDLRNQTDKYYLEWYVICSDPGTGSLNCIARATSSDRQW